jgi:hypothetical protein
MLFQALNKPDPSFRGGKACERKAKYGIQGGQRRETNSEFENISLKGLPIDFVTLSGTTIWIAYSASRPWNGGSLGSNFLQTA